ncbi:aminotransferase class III-fold pyridoxal phosphate-dependent enzyme [Marinomonas sp. RSW2]|uniref:Aminotransferase class III-fold pyridoxal phosphate-dependent enzyme n=1 Tax=Marinomonas maritima TaxID=2940935 RepID=A0ABT5WE64_9GAMM|nr:aminotransferase class III-fold pyridoxal phosphate-dependent enzyme [Marinomonas maritima]MDE8603116.1 aminotransferase class III-fold pyridoxal phosphate-dependent enzyme [Marinomonas maritima]
MPVFWRNVLKRVWGVDAQLSSLDGEYDLNLLATGQRNYVLKVMRPSCEESFIDLQCRAFNHLRQHAQDLPIPDIIKTLEGELYTRVKDENGENRIVWLLEKIEGVTYACFGAKNNALRYELGATVGEMDRALQGFTHPALVRDFKWNLCQAQWIAGHIDTIVPASRNVIIQQIIDGYYSIHSSLLKLPQGAIHNDVNDYNILIQGSLTQSQRVSGIIDLGDMCSGPRICDLAISSAYLVLDCAEPVKALEALVSGYHSRYPLTTEEIEMLWPLLRMRLAVSVVNSMLMAKETPDDPYVVISQAPAWTFLENHRLDEKMLSTRLRVVCGFPITDSAPRVTAWLKRKKGCFAQVLGQNLTDAPMHSLSVEACTTPSNPFAITSQEASTIGCDYGYGDAQEESIWLGYYNEPRLIYTEDAFRKGPYKASNRRTVHLGVDVFAPATTLVYTPLDSKVVCSESSDVYLDYGGMVILSHLSDDGDCFYTLYGHLDPTSINHLVPGQLLSSGTAFAKLGDVDVNGGWNPHLHFQLALSLEGIGHDWPGAADPDELVLWNAIFPNPASLLNLSDKKTCFVPTQKAEILNQRKAKFGDNLKLTYSDPVMFMRGWKHHLFDEWGRPYLDSYNNVPHVGHAHPRIQQVAADQLLRMNSNTRYLHPAQIAFADKVLSRMPKSLDVCFFVNSGTEANELALRLARAHTGGKDMITPDHGYHGNTTGAIDISAYKFNAKGGVGQADWVQLIDVADDYRGRYRRDDPQCAEKYAAQVDNALANIKQRHGKLAGFIAETFPSVGGQIIPPQGYLKSVYARVRAVGGVCIADEVQTALGRLGEYYFAFEQQQVVPDIVVLGKPIGNGHPIGVLVTSRAIADSFAQGPEYFSTFGGSNLSCRIGKEVLDIVDDENLMDNALQMGNLLLDGLHSLHDKYDIVGDVRGQGLFIGLDLVTDKESRTPGTDIADYVKNRMRENRILMGTEGPADNILKIRPPMCIERQDVLMILNVMDKVLAEAQSLINMKD